MMGMSFEEVLGAGSTEERLIVARVEAASGHRTPFHTHKDPICFCAVQGEINIYSGASAELHRLSPGQALYLPSHVRHGTYNDGDGPARFVVISTMRTRDFYHNFGMVQRVDAFRRG